MDLIFNKNLAIKYKSMPQKARVLTEHWVGNAAYCPNCGCVNIEKYPNNHPVADFFCSHCGEDYELKSKQNYIGTKIVDGAYHMMLKCLQTGGRPNFFLLNYDWHSLSVLNFFVIPKHFFIPAIIEKRKPLALTARRAGWVGCNILLGNIPQAGKIFFIKNGVIEPKEKVLTRWHRTLFLREERNLSTKGWLLDVMHCIEKTKKGRVYARRYVCFRKGLKFAPSGE